MTLPGFKDHFSEVAAKYKAFRPAYPAALFAFLAEVAPSRELVWDCGTGNGQAAVALADHFAKVFATDASAEQVKNAEPHSRVEYVVAPAEKCPLPNGCVDLVTVAQALHWFDFEKFYSEVRRVCRPGGLLATMCYYAPSLDPEIDPVIRRWEKTVGEYWPPERVWVDAGYRTIPFPFEELQAPRFELTLETDLPRLLGYLGTWSATKEFVKAKGFSPLDQFGPEFTAAWGNPATVRTLRWEFNVRLGRVA